MPGQSHGYDNNVVIGTENNYGEKATAFNWIGVVESFEPEENNNVDQRRSVGVRAPFALRQGGKEVDGSLSFALQNARFFAYALGKVATTGDGSTTPYKHTITPVGSGEELPSFTIQNNNPLLNLVREYVGGKVDSFTLSASVEEAVMVESDMQFQKVDDTNTTPTTVTAEVDNYFMFYEGTMKINNTAVADITEFEMEIANGLERRFTLNGSRDPQRIEEGSLEISSSLTMDFTNIDQWEAFNNGDNLVIELTLQDVADPEHSMTVTLSGGLYDTNSLPVGAEDLQEQELEAVFTDIEIVSNGGGASLL